MKASGYTPKMIRSRAPKEPDVSAADAEAIWSEGSPSSSSPATPPQDLAQSAPEASSSREAADTTSEPGEATRSYGMYRPLGITSSPPGSTSQSGSSGEASSTGTRQPYWRRQYIFCAATMPSGSGDKKDKSISKVSFYVHGQWLGVLVDEYHPETSAGYSAEAISSSSSHGKLHPLVLCTDCP